LKRNAIISSSHSRFDFGTLASDYDSWYETSDGRLHDAAQKQAVLSLLPAPSAGGRRSLLDIGCGTGHWSVFFAEQGFEVIGVDISPEMISVARARNALHCRFDVADVMKLPFLNESFDVVSAMAVLEFVPDARQVCMEMIRYLKSGGCLMVGVLNRFAGINKQRVTAQSEPYASAQMFTPEELHKLLIPFGDMNIRLTMEGDGIPRQTSVGLSKAGREHDGGDESGAFIVAAVMKP